MIFQEKEIALKNGETAILKTPEVSDAEQMLDYIRKSCAETDFLIRYPEEWNMTIEQEAAWITGLRSSPNTLAIACYLNGWVVGNCEINFMTPLKMRHRAEVHIAILRDYWGLGIGSALFTELMKAAKANSDVQIVELEFMEGNHRAQALYEKFGFRIVGEHPNEYRLKDGTMLAGCLMQKNLRA